MVSVLSSQTSNICPLEAFIPPVPSTVREPLPFRTIAAFAPVVVMVFPLS